VQFVHPLPIRSLKTNSIKQVKVVPFVTFFRTLGSDVEECSPIDSDIFEIATPFGLAMTVGGGEVGALRARRNDRNSGGQLQPRHSPAPFRVCHLWVEIPRCPSAGAQGGRSE